MFFNHWKIFHGPAKGKLLKAWKAIHTRHHKSYFKDVSDEEKTGALPWWGWAIYLIVTLPIFIISPAFALGMFSYMLLNEINHITTHYLGERWPFGRAHLLHHQKAKYNHASIYTFWDKLFGTYRRPS